MRRTCLNTGYLPLFFFEVVISRRIRHYVRKECKHSNSVAKIVILIQITNQTSYNYETINKNRIRNLVITEKVTKSVTKIVFITAISDFKNGDTVCLKHTI